MDSQRSGAASTSDTYRSGSQGKAGSDNRDVVTEITQHVLDTYMETKKWRLQAHRHITFRSEAFNLESLDGLLAQPIDLTSLESLDVSNNSLKDLHCVEGKSEALRRHSYTQGHMRLQSLRVLKARRNLLTEFVCVMPTLRELDLSWNDIRKVPPTAGLVNLEVIVLSHNSMEGSWNNLGTLEKLKKLDLSDNRFNFKPSLLGKEVDILAGLHNLVSLRIKDNLFARTTTSGGCFPEYQSYVLKRLRHLHDFDDLAYGELAQAKKIADALGEFDLDQYDVMVWNRKKVINQTAPALQDISTQVPTWSELSSALEEGLVDHEMLPKTVKQVARISSQVAEVDPMQVNEIWRDSATKVAINTESASWCNEVESKMRGFLDNYMILLGRVEDNMAWRVMLIRSLAKLSTVHTPVYASSHGGEKKQRASLGVKCIETLGFLMKRSEDIEEEIIAALREIVIEPLSARNHQADVPINTVQALCHLESPKLPEALSPIVKWLAKMYCEGNGYPQPDLAHLFAVATSNTENAREAMEASMGGKDSKDYLPRHVMMALENKKLYQAEDCREQYIAHLVIIKNTALVDVRAIEIFQEKQLHRDLMKNFKDFFGDDIDAAENGRQKGHNLMTKRQLNLRTCGHIISTLNAVMSSREVLLDLLDASHSWGRLEHYLAIAPKASPVADPMLLAASLNGMLTILKKYPKDNESARQTILSQIVRDLNKMKPMMEIIDSNSSKYRELTDAAERHVVERENRKQVVSTQVPRFGNLHNPLVHQCFQSIVELIEFFTAEAKKDKICAEVNDAMNGADRETLLFKLLEVPNDALQEAVMECFKQVDLADMSAEEVEYLIKLLDNVKDVASEADVLENIIRQMCLFAGVQSGDSGPAINKDNAEFSINAVMRVFIRNARRETFGRAVEEVAKHRLSQACISFLQTASTVHDLRSPHMRSKFMREAFAEALKLEDDLCAPSAPDVVVECTWSGGDVETLLQSLAGAFRLKARGKVAFRVISRLADVLEGNQEMQHELLNQSRTLQGICKRESAMWDEEKIRSELKYLSDIERDDRTMQQRVFSQYAGLDRIGGFLEGLFPDEAMRTRSIMEETAAMKKSQEFVEVAKASANASSQEMNKEGGKVGLEAIVALGPNQTADLDNKSDSSTSDSEDVEVPSLEFSGARRTFSGRRDDPEVDLGENFDGELGGAMSIFFIARWDSLPFKSRVMDFGSGCPKDNIVIGNQAETNNIVFEYFNGTDEISTRFVVANCIDVGVTHKYLATITAAGHIKIWRDGTILGERSMGCAPRHVQRDHYYIGRSHWSRSVPFHGLILELKVWNGKAFDWDDVVKDEAGVESEDQEEEDVVDRHFLMKAFLHVGAEDEPPQKQELQGGLDVQAQASKQGNVISEQIFGDEEEGELNMAYTIVAVLRACFAMLKVPANDKIRRDMVKALCQWLMISRLETLVSLVSPFSCRVAAKFLRLMSSALELPASETSAKLDLVVALELSSAMPARLCSAAVMAAKQQDNWELHVRGCELCTEIVRLTAVVCRSVSFCICSEVKQVQLRFTELYLERLVPIAVIKYIIQMLLVDSKPGDEGKGMGEEIWELSRAVLSQLLDNCSRMKHPILKAFSENLVSSKVSLRPSFLSALLAQSRQGYEKTQVEHFLNGEENPYREGSGVERAVISAKVQVLISGKPLVFQDSRHKEASFICLLTNKGFYIIDLTAPGYPERPSIVQYRRFADMSRLLKGEASQVLYVGWVTGDQALNDPNAQVNEQMIVLICHSEPQRNDLFQKLYVLSEPPGGQMRHRAVIQSDSLFRLAMESKVPEMVLLSAFVLVDRQLRYFVLGEGHLYECSVNFEKWLPPLDDEDDAADHTAMEDEDPAQAKKSSGVGKEGSEADQIAARRLTARLRFESTWAGEVEKFQARLLTFVNPPRQFVYLEKVAFYPEKQPRMALFFENETVEMVFLDDTTRERWRKVLMAQLARITSMEDSAAWSRTLESNPLALTR